MDARIIVDEEAVNADGGLAEWLRREPELRGLVRSRRRPPRPEAMGVPVEIVLSILTSGVISVVARSLRTYLQHRRSDVKIEVETERGRASLSVLDAKNPEELLHKLLSVMDPSPSLSPSPEGERKEG
jgi:hypothetical protein